MSDERKKAIEAVMIIHQEIADLAGKRWSPGEKNQYRKGYSDGFDAGYAARDAEIERLRTALERAVEIIADHTEWRRGQGVIPKNENFTHGTCCTCQTCGRDYDSCVCEHNKIAVKMAEIQEGE